MSHFHQSMTNDTIYNTKSNPQYHYSGTSVDSKDTLIKTSACVSLTDKYNYSNSKRTKSYVFFLLFKTSGLSKEVYSTYRLMMSCDILSDL